MNLEQAAEKACQESQTVIVAKRLHAIGDAEIETIYKMGFADGALHGLSQGLSQWNKGADQVSSDKEKPAWLRDVLTGARDRNA